MEQNKKRMSLTVVFYKSRDHVSIGYAIPVHYFNFILFTSNERSTNENDDRRYWRELSIMAKGADQTSV